MRSDTGVKKLQTKDEVWYKNETFSNLGWGLIQNEKVTNLGWGMI